MSAEEDWPCEAYGEEGAAVGAWCFAAAGRRNFRVCAVPEDCALVMALQRRRVFRRIQERAAAGDPTAAYLEEAFRAPDELLGGPG